MSRRQRRPDSRSKYTEDRGLPGAFDGETITRRRLMTGTANAVGAVAAAAFTLPALGFAVAPVFEHPPETWQEIGPLSRFTEPSTPPK